MIKQPTQHLRIMHLTEMKGHGLARQRCAVDRPLCGESGIRFEQAVDGDLRGRDYGDSPCSFQNRSLPRRRTLLPYRADHGALPRPDVGAASKERATRRWAKFDNTPRGRTRTSRPRGPNSRALSGIFASGSNPLKRRSVYDKGCRTGRLFNCNRNGLRLVGNEIEALFMKEPDTVR